MFPLTAPIDLINLKNLYDTCCEKSLSCVHFNLRSGRNKQDELEYFFSEAQVNFDVVMFSETWFASEDDVFTFPTYKSYYMNRTGKRGGGVAMLISSKIDCELMSEFSCISPLYEILTVRCGTSVFCVCYRPPSNNVRLFFSFLDSLLEFVSEKKYALILGGDLNINMLAESSVKLELESMLSSHYCQNVITAPTRITSQSSTLLDLFITNFDTSLVTAGTLIHNISDHMPIFMFVNQLNNVPKQVRAEFSYRLINPETLTLFRERLGRTDWSNVFAASAANLAYDLFMNKFTEIYLQCFPLKSFKTFKKSRKPWVNKECLKLIRKRDQLFKAFIVSKSPEALKAFKKHRNFVTKRLRDEKKLYYSNLFNSTQGRTENVWKAINSTLNNPPEELTKIVKDGTEIQGPDLADAFNDFFLSVGGPTTSSTSLKYMNIRNNQTIFLEPISESELVATFLTLSNSKATDADNIQMKPVKYVIDILAPCLAYIFNICLSTGHFPRNMQIAKVTVIYKKGPRNDMSNYRPISILPVFSKGLEKIILKRLNSFTDKFNLITSAQYGFRKNKSTELALLAQKEYILENFESRNMVLGLFLDFSKAFDLINHKILLQKLDHYGIRGVAHKLITSYLQHRTQFVVIQGKHSATKSIKTGVPQGSILGPFLFILYVNEIVRIDESAHYIIYADDTSLFFSSRCSSDLGSRANNALSKINTWAQENSLKLNIKKKQKLFYFTPATRKFSFPSFR